ncbi:putative G-protein coupled receptor 160 [Chanos chanos]|uniref:G-protein coupled receptor 160 n=1 Tax=Chanos chanos TaxID=29144 RepID=A0A6J2VGP6_CHACN|nr:probable G-protein coupled receptor 160 [Chanos chanos]
METLIPTLLLVLGLKSLLNWILVLIQRHHVVQSFSGFFSVSLAAIDTLLTFILAAICFLEDFFFLGLRFTKYHICLLIQIICFIYGVLHWPVLLLMGLDHYCTLCPNSVHIRWARKLTYAVGVSLLWILAVLYVFLLSGFCPALDDDSHQALQRCQVLSSPESYRVSFAVLLIVACFALYSQIPMDKWKSSLGHKRTFLAVHIVGQPRTSVLKKTLFPFLSTWVSFITFVAFILVFKIEIPAYLSMNVPWLCFLNSFFIVMVKSCRSRILQGRRQETL